MKHQHGRESAGMIFITRFMNSFLHQASFATGYWYYDRHRSVRLVILVGLAIDQIAQSGLSSLSVIYYSAQLFRITREFFASLHERAEYKNERFSDHPGFLLPYVLTTYPGAQAHLDVLEAEDLIEIDGEPVTDKPRFPPEIGLRLQTKKCEYLGWYFEFVKEEQLSFRTIFDKLDFSGF